MIEADFPHSSLRFVSLTEADGEHSTLIAEAITDAGFEAADEALGSDFRFVVREEGKSETPFDGIVTEIDFGPGRWTVTARSRSVLHDLARRTATFGDGLAPHPLPELEGASALWEGVDDLQFVDAEASVVVQADETDFACVRRLAAHSGRVLRVRGRRLAVSGATATVRKLTAKEVEPDWRGKLTLGASGLETRQWSVSTGEVPAPHAPTEPGSKTLDLPSPFATGMPARAERLAASLRADRAGLRATVRDPAIRNGDVVTFPAELGIPGSWLVYRRILSPDERQRGWSNVLECCRSEDGPRLPKFPPQPMRVCVGQVCAVADPAGRGRVKINFPWQARTGEPAAWPGVWAVCPQSAAGYDDNKVVHGTLELPALFDWVVALLPSEVGDPPVVLGAIYRGTKTVAADAKTERVWLDNPLMTVRTIRTERGMLFAVRGRADGVETPLLEIADDGAIGICGTVELRGTIKVRKKT